MLKSLPFSARSLFSKILTLVPVRGWDAVLAGITSLAKPKKLQNCDGDSVHRLADRFLVDSPTDLYSRLISGWQECGLVLGDDQPLTAFADLQPSFTRRPLEHQMMWRDSLDYLPDDILVKVDRASMAVSLESRIPLLDHRVVEFALKVPLTMKVRDRQGKWLLRQVLYKYVPRGLIERPKMGFGVPVGEWLRGPLLDWAENLLSEKRLGSEGWFDPKPIRKKWLQHRAGTRNWQYHLWTILMFQAWQEQETKCASEGSNLVGNREFASISRPAAITA
jgi:asparagine synthase (glutamine-hydrolysing)